MSYRLETDIVHCGEVKPYVAGAVSLPIFQSTVFHLGKDEDNQALVYPRLNNLPNHLALQKKLAAIDKGEAALVTASGMAAISTTLMTVLGAGGHLLAQRGIYGGAQAFITHDLPTLGMSADIIDLRQPESWSRFLRPETRALYIESISNPLLEVPDFSSLVAFAKAHGLTTIIDNTFATPINFRPLPVGFDIVVQSATKYLSGHSDVIAGTVTSSKAWIEKIKERLVHTGGTLDAHACFLLHRGIKTLALRIDRQNKNAMAIAEFLDQHPAIEHVYYPGLHTRPENQHTPTFFRGFGGMISFEVRGGAQKAGSLIDNLEIPIHGASLGGVETLISRPARTSHGALSTEERRKSGITEGLIRLSVGIEAADDLINDFERAFASINK